MTLRLLGSADDYPTAIRPSDHHLRLVTAESSPPRGDARGRFWRPLPRKVVDVICGEITAAEVPFHAHEALQVLLPTSPLVVIGGGGRSTVVAPGMIHVTGPLEPRAARGLDGATFSARIMLLPPAVLTPQATDSRVRAPSPVPSRGLAAQPPVATPSFADLVIDDAALCAELMALFDALRRPVVALECASQLAGCIGRLLARHAGPGRARPTAGVVRVRDFLREHPVQNVTLDDLASVAGLSKFYLLRAFYRAYGLTPHAYQMQLRLARARRLLAEGRPLSHVTYDAGFADQSHLTRRFAAFYGVTPARYARQLAAPWGSALVPSGNAVRALTPPSAA